MARSLVTRWWLFLLTSREGSLFGVRSVENVREAWEIE